MKKFLSFLVLVILMIPVVTLAASGEYELKQENKLQLEYDGASFSYSFKDNKDFIVFKENDEALYISKFTKDAKIIWQKKYSEHYVKTENSSNSSVSIFNVIEQSDGYLVIRRYNDSLIRNTIITKFDKNGDIVNESTTAQGELNNIIELNNTFMLIIDENYDSKNSFLVEIDGNGNILNKSDFFGSKITNIVKLNDIYIASGSYYDSDLRLNYGIIFQLNNELNKINEYQGEMVEREHDGYQYKELERIGGIDKIKVEDSKIIMKMGYDYYIYSIEDNILNKYDDFINYPDGKLYENPNGGYVIVNSSVNFYDKDNKSINNQESILENSEVEGRLHSFLPVEDGYIAVGTFVQKDLYAGAIVKYSYDGKILWTKELTLPNGDIDFEKAFYQDEEIVILGSKTLFTYNSDDNSNMIYVYANKTKNDKDDSNKTSNKAKEPNKQKVSSTSIFYIILFIIIIVIGGYCFYRKKINNN